MPNTIHFGSRQEAEDAYNECHALHEARVAELNEARSENEALRRLIKDNYVSWADAGGPNECVHGRAEGIPCPACDRLRVGFSDTLVSNKAR